MKIAKKVTWLHWTNKTTK